MIHSKPLPTGRDVVTRMLLLTCGYVVLAVAVITLYLIGLLDLPSEQWRGFVEIVAAVLVAIFPAMTLAHWRIFQGIRQCLDRRAAGQASAEDLRTGFAAISDFPRYWYTWGLAWWALGGVLVGVGMWLRHDGFGLFSLTVVIGATVSAAFLTDAYYYFSMKRYLEPIRFALAEEIGDPVDRHRLTHRVSLRTKLLIAMTSVIFVTVIFAALLAEIRTRHAIEDRALRTQERFLASVPAAASDSESVTKIRSEVTRYGIASDAVLLDPEARTVVLGARHSLSTRELDWIRDQGGDAGNSAAAPALGLFAWRRLGDDGAILVTLNSAEDLREQAGGMRLVFILLLVFSTGVGVGVAVLLARDVGRATEILETETARIAAGDLSGGVLYVAEDEMGDLAGAFETMRASVRAIVARVSGAADRMHSTAEAMSDASRGLTEVSATQVEGLDRVAKSVGSIDGEVRRIAETSSGLRGTMDEASTSIRELDATGDALSQIASALLGMVEGVAASISQMELGTSQVAESADQLGTVADDATTHMQQTTQAVLAVDASAAQMGELSERVLALADAGHANVQDTIEGMNAIDEATRSAEQKTGRLVQSAEAIGLVVSVIDDVAEETSLLALNAAIIAAQAGEHGRAFAVVADEIKDLAERVLMSTKEIGVLIESVQVESAEARRVIATGAESVERGVTLAGEAGISLETITRAARQSGKSIAEIVNAVHEQSRAVEHVANLMGRVRAGVEAIRPALWEQGRGSGILRENATEMGNVARQVQNTTVEQTTSFAHLQGVAEQFQEAVQRINLALHEQSSACRSAVEFLDHVALGTRANEASAQELDRATRELRHQAVELQEEVSFFRLGDEGSASASRERC